MGPLGDWLAVEETDMHLLWNAFMGGLPVHGKAGRIARDKDGKYYKGLWEAAACQWNKTFMDSRNGDDKGRKGKYGDTSVRMLFRCVMTHTGGQEKEAGERLAEKVRENGYKISTGFLERD